MEALYHQTNRLLQEVTSNNLVKIERSHTPEEVNEAEAVVIQKLDTIHSNCSRLDILINKEPPARRVNAKYRVDQLKYDLQHVQNSFGMLQHRRQMRAREVEERDALLSRKFTTNDQQDTSIFLDHELQHHDKLGDTNRNVDELLGAGTNILQGLRDQGSTLKGAHKRVLDLANTLGLSNTVMRMIERRSTQDKYILFAGMVIVLLCLYFALKYL
ncbi:Golgi SNAP receptor complex member 2-like [Homarus americanus]|uniref:Golgi SNAP receptor complex member 2-like n=1 Tax=Homarus americanus TaxID=6706 RepID=A0A8J5JXK7_HOMAM|nr:Golgi SNAP receptor complex member 2-like [Homarus americanus]XP_042232035.1 Golgi SNAP receptor complex member 2-like [Homarus americanus]KAG7163364.1 Golgi SNAP receptor complex member 2-like [Homarus americanus]